MANLIANVSNDPDLTASTKELLMEIYETGAPVIPTKEIAYGGETYKPGEEVHLIGGRWDGKLLQQGQLVSVDVWRAMQEKAQAEIYEQSVLRPAYQAFEAAKEAFFAADNAREAADQRAAAAKEAMEQAIAVQNSAEENAPALLKKKLKLK